MELHLTSSRLVIRALSSADLNIFARYRALSEIARYQSWSSYSVEDASLLYKKMSQQPFGTIGHWFQLAVLESVSNILIGDLAVHFTDEQQIEIGVTMSPEYQGLGLAKEAVIALLDYLFFVLKKHRVIAITDVDNHSSVNLFNRLGFRQEANFVDNIFFKGAWGSEYVFAMLARDWSGR